MRDLLPYVQVPFITAATGTLFFLLFLGILWSVYSRNRREHFQEMAGKAIDDSDLNGK